METLDEEEIRKTARLAWALQILMRDVLDELHTLGRASDLLKRLERLEILASFPQSVMTSEEVCEQLGIGKSQLNELVDKQNLRTFRPSDKQTLFRVKDVAGWMAKHPGQRGICPKGQAGLMTKETAEP